MNRRSPCTACAGQSWWRAYDPRFHTSSSEESRIAVCPLCLGTGLMPDYPEFQPTRPPSHYARFTPSWCLNAAMNPCDGHQPCTTLVGILHVLAETGDKWRLCSLDEFPSDPHAQAWAKTMLPYSTESRSIATFCSEWRRVFNWEDQDGRSMMRLALQTRAGEFKGRYTTGEVMVIPPPLPI